MTNKKTRLLSFVVIGDMETKISTEVMSWKYVINSVDSSAVLSVL